MPQVTVGAENGAAIAIRPGWAVSASGPAGFAQGVRSDASPSPAAGATPADTRSRYRKERRR